MQMKIYTTWKLGPLYSLFAEIGGPEYVDALDALDSRLSVFDQYITNQYKEHWLFTKGKQMEGVNTDKMDAVDRKNIFKKLFTRI